jgi:hypothetical protein
MCRMCLVALTLGLAASSASAQTPTATLFLETRDADGTPLAKVNVHLVHLQTGIERIATTTDGGTAIVPLLPVGLYTVRAVLAGYKQAVVNDLKLDAGGKGTLILMLTRGAFEDTVVVTADTTRVRAGDSSNADTFDGRTLVMLPAGDRDFLQFTYQAPGAAPPAPGSRLSTEGNAGVNVSGAREGANNFLLDGIDNNDLFLNRVVVTPSLDAIQEFTLTQNTYDAEYGRNAGAQVNVVLKSGGSETHGSLFGYFRHEALDARGVFDDPAERRPQYRRNQFGGTLGGPLSRLSSFYFVSVEALRTRSAETRLTTVPTVTARAGDFSGTAVTVVDPLTGVPFPGNRIPQDRIDPAGARVAALYPDPNRSAPHANFASAPAGSRDGVQLAIKTDHHRWPDRPWFVRYALTTDDREDPFIARGRNVPGFGIAGVNTGQNLAVGFSQVLSPRLLNELRVGWNRLHRDNVPLARGTDTFSRLGIDGPALPPDDQGYSSFTLAGYEPLGDDPNLPLVRRTHTLHVSDSLTLERGRQLVKVGGEIRHYRSDGFNHLFGRGQVVFTGSYSGDALADLLLGLPSVSLLATNDNRQALRTTAVNLFAQHDWRPTATFTLNTGLRYEMNAPPVDAEDRMQILDLDTFEIEQVGRNGVPRSGVRNDWNNLAPRVGLSWLVPGRSGLTLRAGYGLYYDSGTLIENSALYFNPPYFDLRVFGPAAQPLTLAHPFPTDQSFTPSPAINTLDPDFRTAVAQHGSVGVERRVWGADVLVRYVGSHGSNLVRRRNINQPAPGPGDIDPRRPIAGYGDILLVEPRASSDYHALQIRAERQQAGGLLWRAAYTWSKSIDDASAFLPSEGNDNTPQDARRPEADRGLSDFDVRQRLSIAGVWVPPQGASMWSRGWQLSAILAVQSGRPFTPRVSFDNSNTGNVGNPFGYDRPNEVEAATAPADAVFYEGRAFVIAPPYSFGTAGRNILIGPASATLDVAAGKSFRLGADRKVELRGEVYNLFNRSNLGLPESFVDRPTFGQSVSADAPRQGQVVVRVGF